jgi:hypothetical protein
MKPLIRGRDAMPVHDPSKVKPFAPPGATLASSRAEVDSTLKLARAIVYITFDWSGPERLSRSTFIDLIRRLEQEHPELEPSCFVFNEKSEGIGDWSKGLNLPTTVATGYGPLIWLERGRWVQLVPYAAEKGTNELLKLTAGLWRSPTSL